MHVASDTGDFKNAHGWRCDSGREWPRGALQSDSATVLAHCLLIVQVLANAVTIHIISYGAFWKCYSPLVSSTVQSTSNNIHKTWKSDHYNLLSLYLDWLQGIPKMMLALNTPTHKVTECTCVINAPLVLKIKDRGGDFSCSYNSKPTDIPARAIVE